jgi:hypothetical protein
LKKQPRFKRRNSLIWRIIINYYEILLKILVRSIKMNGRVNYRPLPKRK